MSLIHQKDSIKLVPVKKKGVMKTNLALFLFSVASGVVLMVFYTKFTEHKPTPTPAKAVSNLTQFDPQKAPSESLKGAITSFSGIVKWQSRIATEAAQISFKVPIQQGEQIETEADGRATVEFQNVCSVRILPNSKVNFAQTLPTNLVMVQRQGSVEYQKLGEDNLSVRVLHLLIELNSGDATISISQDQPQVFVYVKKGSITVAFNDAHNISQEITVKQDQELDFNDITRQATFE